MENESYQAARELAYDLIARHIDRQQRDFCTGRLTPVRSSLPLCSRSPRSRRDGASLFESPRREFLSKACELLSNFRAAMLLDRLRNDRRYAPIHAGDLHFAE